MTNSAMWILVTLIIYFAMMLLIGLYYAKQNTNSEDFFLGGRGLTGPVAALSAQASDMSGWLLMGLPGAIYIFGTGQAWIAVGLFIGTVANWLFIASPLRRYTIRANNSLTLPAFFENRFHDKKRILLGVSSLTISIFFLVYTASAFASGGKFFASVFGITYYQALTISAFIILAYTFLGGFMAVCATDFIQGVLMLVALLVVPILAYATLKGGLSSLLASTNVPGGVAGYLDLFSNGQRPYTAVEVISQLAWGLGYCGMPHILVRFMAVKNEKEMMKSKSIGITWVALSLFAACAIGIIGRAFLAPMVLEGSKSEYVFIQMILKLFVEINSTPIIAGLFLCGILAAIMSTADSQLLVSASSIAEDIFRGIVKPDAREKTVLFTSRVTVLVVAVLAYLIALDPNSSIMKLVSDAWAGLGAAFGPTVLMSLFWRRCNFYGAFCGIVSGAVTVIVWDYIPLCSGMTPSDATGLYSLAVGFAVSLLCVVAASLVTKAPSEEILKEFDDVRNAARN